MFAWTLVTGAKWESTVDKGAGVCQIQGWEEGRWWVRRGGESEEPLASALPAASPTPKKQNKTKQRDWVRKVTFLFYNIRHWRIEVLFFHRWRSCAVIHSLLMVMLHLMYISYKSWCQHCIKNRETHSWTQSSVSVHGFSFYRDYFFVRMDLQLTPAMNRSHIDT